MNTVRSLIVLAVATGISGCTALGFATDMAIHSALEKEFCDDGPSCPSSDRELFFTKKGLKQDLKIVGGVIDDVQQANKQAELAKVEQEQANNPAPPAPKILVCKDVVDGQQRCYPKSYYQGMYIDEDAE
jgi:hypothetical protein